MDVVAFVHAFEDAYSVAPLEAADAFEEIVRLSAPLEELVRRPGVFDRLASDRFAQGGVTSWDVFAFAVLPQCWLWFSDAR